MIVEMQVGNAVTDNYYDNLGTVTYWWSHAMISDKTYHQLISTCDFKRQKESNECESLYYYAMDQEFGNIDQYNIYAPPCNNSDGSTGATRQTMNLPHRPHRVHNFIISIVYSRAIIQYTDMILTYFSLTLLFFFPPFVRFLESYQGMILVQRNMLKYITIGQMFKKLYMQTQPEFHTNGLLAGIVLYLAQE